jgi:hypothetical protein
MAKHFRLDNADGRLTYTRDQAKIVAEAALDRIYVVRTPLAAAELDCNGVVGAYKALSHVERDFRVMKVDDPRPAPHPPLPVHLSDRVPGRPHVLIYMLAAYVT